MNDLSSEDAAAVKAKRLANLKPFPAGVSGNPLGRAVGTKTRATIVKEILALRHESGQTYEYAATKAIADKAVAGDVNAWDKLMDSAHGKLTEKSQVEMAATVSRVERKIIDPKTNDNPAD